MAKKIQPWDINWETSGGVGGGGQGTTKIVKHRNTGQVAILKVLNNQKSIPRRSRMMQEILSLKSLEHPNIPKVIESNLEDLENLDRKLYFISDLIEGCTVEEYIRENGVMSLKDAIAFILKICEVIAHSHSRGIYHRDIKPDNIVLQACNPASPFLIDFGLSFDEGSEKKNHTPEEEHVGNRFLSLPETRIAQSNKRDSRSDVTMVCGILIYALTGEQPTDLLDDSQSKPHQRAREREVLKTFSNDEQRSLNRIFDIGFNQIINDRWQSVESLTQEIEVLNTEKKVKSEVDIKEKLLAIKASAEQRSDFNLLETTSALFNRLTGIIRRANTAALTEMTSNYWGSIQSGHYVDVAKHSYGFRLGIQSKLEKEKQQFFPWIKCYLNGSEYIIECEENGNRSELLRFSMTEIPTDEQLLEVFKNFYIDGVFALLDN